MRNTVAEKPTRVVSVRLNEVDAIRLHAHRKEYGHAMSRIVMAGVEALEEGTNPEYSWFNRMMGATVRQTNYNDVFIIEGVGFLFTCKSGYEFRVSSKSDVFVVVAPDTGGFCYAGTRHNCELVAEHLNKILREVEEKVSNE